MAAISSRHHRIARRRASEGRREGAPIGSGRRRADPEERQKPPRWKRLLANRRVVTLALLTLLAVTLLAAVPGLRGVVRRVRHVDPLWVLLAVSLELASEVCFVAMFRLFFDRASARNIRRMAWTELASGALLPGGGAGGLAIGGWLMHVAGAPTRFIVRRSEALFFLSGAVSSAALIGAGLALTAGAPGPHGFTRAVLPTMIALPGTLAIAALPWILRSRPNAPRWLRSIAAGVREAERTTFTRRPSWRLVAAVGYLGFDIAVLWVALRAVGRPPTVPALIMGYSIGYVANSVPVPAGIGVLDAGLTGALALYGVSASHAAAAVIIYHAIALWVPGAGGLYAYVRLRPTILEASRAAHSPDSPDPGIKGDRP